MPGPCLSGTTVAVIAALVWQTAPPSGAVASKAGTGTR